MVVLKSSVKKKNSISDAQFDFRKGQSTVDAMFALQSIVHMYLNRNQRLYVAFIDLKNVLTVFTTMVCG